MPPVPQEGARGQEGEVVALQDWAFLLRLPQELAGVARVVGHVGPARPEHVDLQELRKEVDEPGIVWGAGSLGRHNPSSRLGSY